MKIIILGSNGMLGNYINKILSTSYEILTLTREEFDITKEWSLLHDYIKFKNKLETILNLQNGDYIINCFGKIPQKSDNTNIDINNYIIINSIIPLILNDLCLKYKSKLIHITTDCIYSGKKGKYTEYDISDTDTIYGITKSISDNINCCIIRTSIIGEELYYKKSLLEWVKSNKNGEINGYTNHMWNGVSCLLLAKIIKRMIDDNIYWIGVRHIYSNTISKYDLCNYINEIYKLNIKINNYEDLTEKDMTLSSIFDNNIFKIPSIKEQIIELEKFTIELN